MEKVFWICQQKCELLDRRENKCSEYSPNVHSVTFWNWNKREHFSWEQTIWRKSGETFDHFLHCELQCNFGPKMPFNTNIANQTLFVAYCFCMQIIMQTSHHFEFINYICFFSFIYRIYEYSLRNALINEWFRCQINNIVCCVGSLLNPINASVKFYLYRIGM